MSRWTQADDELMWMVAESRDDAAIEELIARKPELRSETLRRATMIAGLKGAKPEFGDLHRVPDFRQGPTPWRQRPKVRRWVLLGLPAVALAIVVLKVAPSAIQRKDDGSSSYAMRGSEAASTANNEKGMPPNPYSVEVAPATDPGVAATNSDIASLGTKIREPRVTLREERIKLADAIQRIGQQAGIAVDIAPGLPDFEITARYTDVPAREALGDMGKNFGFTVFDQGDRSILIIPAVDHTVK